MTFFNRHLIEGAVAERHCPEGWRFLLEGEVIREGDGYFSLAYGAWLEVNSSIGHCADGTMIRIRRIRDRVCQEQLPEEEA